MINATATASASSAFHHTAECSHAAAPVPATTGATALGSVRGRAPEIHCAKLATKTSCQDAGPGLSKPRTRDQTAAMHNNGRLLGVIGGSGFYTFFESETRNIDMDTPYGRP